MVIPVTFSYVFLVFFLYFRIFFFYIYNVTLRLKYDVIEIVHAIKESINYAYSISIARINNVFVFALFYYPKCETNTHMH